MNAYVIIFVILCSYEVAGMQYPEENINNIKIGTDDVDNVLATKKNECEDPKRTEEKRIEELEFECRKFYFVLQSQLISVLL